MKRPKIRCLVLIGVLWLCLAKEINSLKATSLIFAKTTTTTTTTTEAPAIDDDKSKTDSEADAQNATVTKSPYTGIPQIDYLLDPNLPRELNGYNLTEYPFYATVPPPEEMNFKCDGLHDGFYASVPHKCQVYHHCLFGTRYDFLCANYTAFDQKTFICHFVSEVDCVNSPKYYHRNDALYQAASTTTVAPTTPVPTQAPALPAVAPRRPLPPGVRGGGASARRRRPYRRRRPQYDYYDDELEDYDDYYEDEPVRRRRPSRPRNNRRPDPVYDDYDDDYDPRFDRRGTYNDQRKSSDERRRPADNRRPLNDRDVDDDRQRSEKRRLSDDRVIDEDRRKLSDDRKYDRRRPVDSERRKPPVDDADVEERRSYDDRRRKNEDDTDRRTLYNRRKPTNRRPSDDRRSNSGDRRTVTDDVYDREKPGRRTYADDDNRRYPTGSGDDRREDVEVKVTVKPAGGSSVFNKPRPPPIIRRPVPLNERDKYDYTSTQAPKSSKVVPSSKEDYYDDEYEDVDNKYKQKDSSTSPTVRKQTNDRRSNQRPGSKRRPLEPEEDYEYSAPVRSQPYKRRPGYRSESTERNPLLTKDEPDREFADIKPKRPVVVEDSYVDDKPKVDDTRFRSRQRTQTRNKPTYISTTEIPTQRPVVVEEEYYDDEDYDMDPIPKTQRKENINEYSEPYNNQESDRYTNTNAKSETNSKDEGNLRDDNGPKTYIKVVKRPFLPSRGGNPLAARGLLPVGSRALELTPTRRPGTFYSESVLNPKNNENRYSSLEEDDSKSTKIDIRLQKSNKNSEDFNIAGGRNFRTAGSNHQSESTVTKTNYKESPVQSNPQTFRQISSYNTPVQSDQNNYRSLPKPVDITTPEPPRSQNSDNFRNPLDINENEYDVTLNDALNPTIPNIPKRHPPSGFILARDQDYTWSRYQRPLINYEPLHQASSDITYQVYEIDNPNYRVSNPTGRQITRVNGYVSQG